MKVVQTGSTFLEPQLLESLLKLGVFAHVWQLHVHTCTQAGAQVRGAGEDVAKVLIPHESVAPIFEQGLNLKHDRTTLIRSLNTLYKSSQYKEFT